MARFAPRQRAYDQQPRFDLDNQYVSKLDFAKMNVEKVARLVQMEVLMLDEARYA